LTTRLLVTTSYHPSVNHYRGKYLVLDDTLAKQKGINPGNHEAGISWETAAKEGNSGAFKVSYRGNEIWLPKDAVKVVTVEEKGLFDFAEGV